MTDSCPQVPQQLQNGLYKPQCQYFVIRKKRLCRMTVRPGRQYCGEHEPQPMTTDDQDDTRIPCPNDPKHTVYASKLEKHLTICNARATEQPPYIVHNINAPSEIDTCPRKPLSEIARKTVERVIDKVNFLYEKHVKDNITTAPEYPIHRTVMEEFSESDRSESSLRHLRQVSSLLWLAEEEGLVADNTCYVELGAGKGHVSYYACNAWCGAGGARSCALLVDRASLRHKRDNKLRERTAERLRADLAHVALERVPLVERCDAVVGLAKHLCGVATDYALRCMTGAGVLHKTRGVVLATCCHHRCARAAFLANQQLEEMGINSEEFNVMLGIVSWATCGDGRSRQRREKGEGGAATAQVERELEGGAATAQVERELEGGAATAQVERELEGGAATAQVERELEGGAATAQVEREMEGGAATAQVERELEGGAATAQVERELEGGAATAQVERELEGGAATAQVERELEGGAATAQVEREMEGGAATAQVERELEGGAATAQVEREMEGGAATAQVERELEGGAATAQVERELEGGAATAQVERELEGGAATAQVERELEGGAATAQVEREMEGGAATAQVERELEGGAATAQVEREMEGGAATAQVERELEGGAATAQVERELEGGAATAQVERELEGGAATAQVERELALAERSAVGRRAKLLLDWARVLQLRRCGLQARLCYFVPSAVSLENETNRNHSTALC